jgi:hypothetical protein
MMGCFSASRAGHASGRLSKLPRLEPLWHKDASRASDKSQIPQTYAVHTTLPTLSIYILLLVEEEKRQERQLVEKPMDRAFSPASRLSIFVRHVRHFVRQSCRHRKSAAYYLGMLIQGTSL